MNKEFILYTEALALKELGFDEPCFGYYHEDKSLTYTNMVSQNTNSFWKINNKIISAPLYQQAFRWFREKYELSSWVYNSHMDKYFYTILQDGRIVKATESATTFEEAELACLIKLIQIVKGDNNE